MQQWSPPHLHPRHHVHLFCVPPLFFPRLFAQHAPRYGRGLRTRSETLVAVLLLIVDVGVSTLQCRVLDFDLIVFQSCPLPSAVHPKNTPSLKSCVSTLRSLASIPPKPSFHAVLEPSSITIDCCAHWIVIPCPQSLSSANMHLYSCHARCLTAIQPHLNTEIQQVSQVSASSKQCRNQCSHMSHTRALWTIPETSCFFRTHCGVPTFLVLSVTCD